jgi:predicted glycosyltransferase involved in capsule biosynthesis
MFINREEKIKTIIKFIGLLFVLLAFANLFYFRIDFFSDLILTILLVALIFLGFEAYLRIQHNIDMSFGKINDVISKTNFEQIKFSEQKFKELNLWSKDIFRFFLEEKLRTDIPEKDDVTVIIGVKNRCDYRIKNALKSLRNQDYDQNLIKILVIDYGSDEKCSLIIKDLCSEYNAEYFKVNDAGQWNRPSCLNIGIVKAQTKYVLLSDVDIVFEKNYVKEAILQIQKNIYQVVYAENKDTSEGQINENTDIIKEYKSIYEKSKARERFKDLKLQCGISILFTFRKLLLLIGGHDEFYKFWGYEDIDLAKRLLRAGVEISEISNRTSYIHQWHKNREGFCMEDKKYIDQLEKNRLYYENNNSIMR